MLNNIMIQLGLKEAPKPVKAKAPAKKKTVKKSNKAKTVPYLETWNTRYGQSQRVVLRQGGKFVDNTSLTALKRGARVNSR
jgi:hypothetical protein